MFTLRGLLYKDVTSLERSLLGRLQDETEKTEQKLQQQNLKPLDKVLAAAWNTVRKWMRDLQ